jgi:hypothetical protein
MGSNANTSRSNTGVAQVVNKDIRRGTSLDLQRPMFPETLQRKALLVDGMRPSQQVISKKLI